MPQSEITKLKRKHSDLSRMSMNIDNIRSLIDAGSFEKAFGAIDEILALGPTNIEALKLKAFLFGFLGRFLDEARTWKRIVEIDPENQSALEFFHKAYIEERESDFFSERLPSGAKRFLAHPRAIVNASLMGLLGCAVFLGLSNLSRVYLILATPVISLSLFLLLVGTPWLLIIWAYLRTLKEVVVNNHGIVFRTRLRDQVVKWDEVETFHVTHKRPPQMLTLSLVFILKDKSRGAVEVDIGEQSAVRAPSFFVREIIRSFREPIYTNRDQLKLKRKTTKSF